MQLAKNFRVVSTIPMIAGASALLLSGAFAENRYGAERDIGYEVYNLRKDLDSTRSRVTKLEREIAKLGRSVGSDFQVSHQSNHTPPPTSSRSSDGSYHRVSSGDTLSSIARQYQVGVDRLVAENRITNPNALRIGQEVFIPGRKGAPAVNPGSGSRGSSSPAASGGSHTVVRGETLYSIGRRYGVSADAIVQANGMRNPNALRVGQRLAIPGGGSGYAAPAPPKKSTPPAPEPPRGGGRGEEVVAPEGYGFYQVEPGDTMHSIAISFGTNDGELRRLNDLRTSSLQVGDFLLVPVPDDSLYEG